jgi:hypothetical protein
MKEFAVTRGNRKSPAESWQERRADDEVVGYEFDRLREHGRGINIGA